MLIPATRLVADPPKVFKPLEDQILCLAGSESHRPDLLELEKLSLGGSSATPTLDLEEQYHRNSGVRGDMHLGTLLEQESVDPLTELLRKH